MRTVDRNGKECMYVQNTKIGYIYVELKGR